MDCYKCAFPSSCLGARDRRVDCIYTVLCPLPSFDHSPFAYFQVLVAIISPESARPEKAIPVQRKDANQHRKDVVRLIRTLHPDTRKGRLCTLGKPPGSGHAARSNLYKYSTLRLDVSSLTGYLDLDLKGKTIEVESTVSFSSLCEATLKHGLLPGVVPEFRSITVGGAIQGLGIESTSFIHGTFDQTVIQADLLVPSTPSEPGVPAIVSSQHHQDLWNATVGSCGTAAIVTKAKIQLFDATPLIKIEYIRYDTYHDFLADLEDLAASVPTSEWNWMQKDSICDAIVFENCCIGMFAHCVQPAQREGQGCPFYIPHPGSVFFYEHVGQITSSPPLKLASPKRRGSRVHHEYMHTTDYLFRYDRGGYWGCAVLANHMIPPLKWMLAIPLLRPIFYCLFSTETLYKIALLLSDKRREDTAMLQDVTLPLTGKPIRQLLDWFSDLRPIWLCPVRASKKRRVFGLDGHHKQEMMVNIGLYGIPGRVLQSRKRKSDPEQLRNINRELEFRVAAGGGHKGLYAFIYSNRATFENSYSDISKYDKVRRMYQSDQAFPHVYDKVKINRD